MGQYRLRSKASIHPAPKHYSLDKTEAVLDILRKTGTGFQSKQQMQSFLDSMPFWFADNRYEDFQYSMELACQVPDKTDSFYAVIYADAMTDLRRKNPPLCAKSIISLFEKLPDTAKPEIADILLSGPFAQGLAAKFPHEYADYLFSILATLPEKDADAFAKVFPVRPSNNDVYVVFPDDNYSFPPNNYFLPPIVVLNQVHAPLKPLPILPDLSEFLSVEAMKALNDHIKAEAQIQLCREDYEAVRELSKASVHLHRGMAPG